MRSAGKWNDRMFAAFARSIVGANSSAITWNGRGSAACLNVLNEARAFEAPFVSATTFSSVMTESGNLLRSTLSAFTAKL